MDNGNLLLFSFPVYALLTPFVANQFDLLPDILHEPFLVSTSVGDNVKAEGVSREVDGIVASPCEIKLGFIRF